MWSKTVGVHRPAEWEATVAERATPCDRLRHREKGEGFVMAGDMIVS